ncbi:MAG: 4-phosphopantoate--beta-alanine ligase [Halobacteria archaeon]
MEEVVPDDHPRSASLKNRHRIQDGVEKGITSLQGLVAQGRGEAFDYLIGEETVPSAAEAERVAAAQLLLARHPVVSVNGNVAALCPREALKLAETVDGDVEVNIFNRTRERLEAIARHFEEHGAGDVKGLKADAEIPGLSSKRGLVDSDGIHDADVVLVPLEDGDRTEALEDMGKTTIVVDLNPMSRSPQTSTVPVVDNVTRALPNIRREVEKLAGKDREFLKDLIQRFDRDEVLENAEKRIRSGNLD